MTTEADRPVLRIDRSFDAPPQAVFHEWLDPEALRDWFVPETYEGLAAEVDARVGGLWRVLYRARSGKEVCEQGRFVEIVPGQKLVMTLQQSLAAQSPELTIVVTFEHLAPRGTLMRFQQTGFANPAQRDGMAEGWAGCMRKLAKRLGEPEATS